MPNRRAQRRAETTAEIKQAALELIATEGSAGLSIRGIARAIGMSPAGLYRYYDGLDGLITELITDAYQDLAAAVEEGAAGEGPCVERLREAMLAYRAWAVAHPNRFLLIYGTPIPGYQAPTTGPTTAASLRLGAAFLRVVAEGVVAGELAVPADPRPPIGHEQAATRELAPGFPPDAMAPFLGTWAHLHGLVSLEVLHQLDWIYPDAEEFFRLEVERAIGAWLPGPTGPGG